MMRGKPAASMQKTYDDCYLQCSTAIFFEGQNNEVEALRSWKSALDAIKYHNAYKLPFNYAPKTETERALYESLRTLEMQCKERVDLLETLKRSREELEDKAEPAGGRRRLGKSRGSEQSISDRPGSWLEEASIEPVQMPYLPSAPPELPARPSFISIKSTDQYDRSSASPAPSQNSLYAAGAPPTLPVPVTKISRSPSPDQARKTMRTTLRPEKKGFRKYNQSAPNTARRPATLQAAGLAWDAQPRKGSQPDVRLDLDQTIEARLSATAARRSLDQEAASRVSSVVSGRTSTTSSRAVLNKSMESLRLDSGAVQSTPSIPNPNNLDESAEMAPPSRPHDTATLGKLRARSPPRLPKAPDITYRNEYLAQPSKVSRGVVNNLSDRVGQDSASSSKTNAGITRKPVAANAPPLATRGRSPRGRSPRQRRYSFESEEEAPLESPSSQRRPRATRKESSKTITPPTTDDSLDEASAPEDASAAILKDLPKGVDEATAKAILNEIIVHGDEVHWSDVAGLDAAKKALKEAVVYPFLRPDLFMGLREPASGMLLFGPPGTGKTMLARAVATESKSTFFAISASSLTSKWHGESEKLVRALFMLAKALAPSIIFVDEIDSLLSARSGSSEHEASRRSKTEFLIQWSDLQRAAAGRDTSVGDASRVLVLAATNCPWDIDEAARRRFVRRQYIPLPEPETREVQIRGLLGAQKHMLDDVDVAQLVELTEGYSGSDITALAKDAAMGPLRGLGEALLYTPKEQIRPIGMDDFKASLINIRPSVGKAGLAQFEQWARDFGERGG